MLAHRFNMLVHLQCNLVIERIILRFQANSKARQQLENISISLRK